MATWSEFEREVPEFATAVRTCFEVRKHATLATLRRNGSPRISGTELQFEHGRIVIGSMPAAVKALDLRRDGRYALHSPTTDAPSDDPDGWLGEAKVAGVAEEITDPSSLTEPHRFHLSLYEVVLTRVNDGRLVIQSWHEGRGFEERSR